MKKIFETPFIEIIYFDEVVALSIDESKTTIPDWEDDNVDPEGWI